MAEPTQRADVPASGRKASFTPDDFSEVILHAPEGCPIIGGQAVAWWAERYQLAAEQGEAVTSADIDFWGSREDLVLLAGALGRKPVFPEQYEMTVWVGAVQLDIRGRKSLAEFLHTVPGLDTNDPAKASVEQEYVAAAVRKTITVLSAVSLVTAKLHALRHFDQKERQDEFHLRISLMASRRFLTELLEKQEIRQVLWNCERLISASLMKPYRRLESEFNFDIMDAIPIDEIRRQADKQSQTEENRRRLANFAKVRWKQLRYATQ